MSPREGGAMNRGEPPAPLVRQRAAAARLTPGRGDFPFRDFNHAPSDKNLSKNGSVPIKGVGLSLKDAFAKKFLVTPMMSADWAPAPIARLLAERVCLLRCSGYASMTRSE